MNTQHNTRFGCGLLAALALLASAQPTWAERWWNGDWTARKKITIDTTSSGLPIAEPIGTAAVLLRLHGGNFPFDRAREDGTDLRIVAEDNRTILPHHIEKYDALMGEAYVWVGLTNLQPKTQTSFWLYFGNANTRMELARDPHATYDADTVLVYHFGERGGLPVDASAAGNNAQTTGLALDGAFIGGGIRLDEKAVLTIPPSPSLQWTEGGAVTLSLWVKPTALPADAVLVSRGAAGTNVVVGLADGVPYIAIERAGAQQRATAATALPIGGWRHVALVAKPTDVALYVDGEPVATLQSPLPALDGALQIGGAGFKAEIDELQIARVARPAGWLKLAALGQGEAGAKLVLLGPDEGTSSWFHVGYLGIIVRSLTVDGWVAIIILMIMSAISWWVMISKAVYLRHVSRGNAAFIRLWRQVANDLTVLGHADEQHARSMGGRLDQNGYRTVRGAPIYRLYCLGLEELRDRLAADEKRRAAKFLSAQSVQAIRSVLDGGLVRETQKLNARMVLLTIAISGGPFIGLLGTVAGVMITFAGVAQEGEVNVPGIAPGISAALLATVAGLGVAIPSLFGYNYLLTRVKDAISDLHVFIDEFVTKLAECYSGSNGSKPADLDFTSTSPATGQPRNEPLTVK